MREKDPSIDLPETYDRQPIEVNLPPPPSKKNAWKWDFGKK